MPVSSISEASLLANGALPITAVQTGRSASKRDSSQSAMKVVMMAAARAATAVSGPISASPKAPGISATAMPAAGTKAWNTTRAIGIRCTGRSLARSAVAVIVITANRKTTADSLTPRTSAMADATAAGASP
jgi:hypothetical protein